MSDERGHAVRRRGDEFECSCGISWAGDGWGASIIDHLWRYPARELPPPNQIDAIYRRGEQRFVFVDGWWVGCPARPRAVPSHPHNTTQGEHG